VIPAFPVISPELVSVEHDKVVHVVPCKVVVPALVNVCPLGTVNPPDAVCKPLDVNVVHSNACKVLIPATFKVELIVAAADVVSIVHDMPCDVIPPLAYKPPLMAAVPPTSRLYPALLDFPIDTNPPNGFNKSEKYPIFRCLT
jgi:hypothetical protein